MSEQEQKQEKVMRAATAWHPPFYDLMTEGAPPTTEVRTEVVLSQQPRRADLLLLRRKDMPSRDDEARVLRGLWPLALLTPAETPSLRDAIGHMGWRLERLGSGSARIVGAWYTTVIAFIDEVCEAERDDYLRLFSRHRKQSIKALHWMNVRRLRMTTMDNMHELEGYDEMVRRLASSLSPEERLAGLSPEEVLRHYGLDELLRYLRERGEAEGKLPPEMLAALRKYSDETP